MKINVVSVDRNNIVVSKERTAALAVVSKAVHNTNITLSQSPVLRSVAVDVVGNTRYVGASVVAAASTTAPVWRIRRIDDVTKTVAIVNSDTFTVPWADRLALSYA
jgi:hypothetical protein